MYYHQYDSVTKKYLGTGKCQIDPINKILLYPANTTPNPVPAYDPKLFDAFFINGVWELKESEFSKKEKLSQVNADGISLYKKVGDEVIEKTVEEISKEKADKVSSEAKKKASLDLYTLKSAILDRIVLSNATKEETDLIKSYEDILKS